MTIWRLPRFWWSGDGRVTTIEEASLILGKEKVYPGALVCTVWGLILSFNPQVLYPLNILKKCAKQNAKGKADWRLVYIIGLSPRQQYKVRGDDLRKPPAFFEGNRLWLAAFEDSWAMKSIESGYYLINFKLSFRGKKLEEQNLLIEKLGNEYARSPECIVIESIFSIYMISKERLLERELHEGPSIDSYGWQVKVGYNDSSGVAISSFDFRRKDSGVIVYMKPHIPRSPEINDSRIT